MTEQDIDQVVVDRTAEYLKEIMGLLNEMAHEKEDEEGYDWRIEWKAVIQSLPTLVTSVLLSSPLTKAAKKDLFERVIEDLKENSKLVDLPDPPLSEEVQKSST